MSPTGHINASEVWVDEFGYGLGPPTGILVLRHAENQGAIRFPESRDDYVHRLFWSPDGMLAVRRGGATAFVGPRQAFWVRRGSALEVAACDPQTVYVVCWRQAPPTLTALAAGSLRITARGREVVLRLTQPGVPEDEGLALKQDLFDNLGEITPLDHETRGNGLARQVAATVIANPADDTELAAWAGRLHTSVKTLQRDFAREYGVSWSRWRTQLRLRASLAMLDRLPVTEVAHRVGYASPSAYVAAFSREFGETPGAYARRE